MATTQSIDERLDQHGSSGVDVPTSKTKYGSHSSLPCTSSTSSLTTPSQRHHRKSHPTLSDSRLSSSLDNVKNPKRSSRSKNRPLQLNLSLDSNTTALRHSRHDANSTVESTEDEERTSADEHSADDDADSSLRHGEGGHIESVNSSLNSSMFFVDKAVEELITTERTYVRDLHDVIQVRVVVPTLLCYVKKALCILVSVCMSVSQSFYVCQKCQSLHRNTENVRV